MVFDVLGATYTQSSRAYFRHLGPAALTLVAVLAWCGTA